MIGRVSTHLLDTTLGTPAAGIPVTLSRVEGDLVAGIGRAVTDADGRVGALNGEPLEPGVFRIEFDTAGYFAAAHGRVFYPRILVEVVLDGARDHYHVPVLAGSFAFSTYLGS